MRPIEKYWALCKVEYRNRKTPPKSLISFKRIWRNISKNVTERSGKVLVVGLKKKLRQVKDNGVYEPLMKKINI